MCPFPDINCTLSEEEIDIINRIVDNTVDLSTEAIIDYTKLHSGPWNQVYKNYKGVYGVIPKKVIKQYIRRDKTQKELFEFIKNKEVNYEEARFTKKLLKKY